MAEREPWEFDSDDDRQGADAAHGLAEVPPSPNFGTTEEVVARYCHCALCGSNLHFSHVTDFSRNVTQEVARCPECGVKARQILHRLQ